MSAVPAAEPQPPGLPGVPGPSGGAAPAPSRPAADRCPGVLRLHDAGDGPLARVRVPGGLLSAAQLDALASGCGLGNGLAELTSRGSVQVRGLGLGLDGRGESNGLAEEGGAADEASVAPLAGGAGAGAAGLARVLAAGGLLPSAEHDRVRNVIASPLAGRTAAALLDTDPLVAAFDAAVCADPALAALPGRFLFALDDGAGLVDLAASDVGLVAEAAGGMAGEEWRSVGPYDLQNATAPGAASGMAGDRAPTPDVARAGEAGRRWDDGAGGPGAAAGLGPGRRTGPASVVLLRLHLAGRPTTRAVPVAGAVDLLLAAARAFLSLRAERDPTAWHVADLPDGAARLAAQLGGDLDSGRFGVSVTPRRPEFPPGRHAQPDGRIALTALVPLARLEREQLAGLAALLRRLGGGATAASASTAGAAGGAKPGPAGTGDAAGGTTADAGATLALPLLRLSTDRTLTLADLTAEQADDAERGLQGLGLLTAAGSGWQGLTACSGLGACRRARVDVRAAAAARAARRRPGAPPEHWSACPRRCGMKRDVAVGVVAEEDGTVALSRTGVPWRAAPDLRAALALLDHDTTEGPAA